MITAAPHIEQMAAYVLADLNAPEGKTLISLAQNESLRPPSPKAIDAATRALSEGALYPDPNWTQLRLALAAHHRIVPQHILCGNGSLDLIGCLARVYAGPGRATLAPAHGYPFFRTATEMAGGRFDTAPETDVTADVDALVAAARDDTALVFVANPGNPTGTSLPVSEISRLRAELRADVLLVIDEAYGEFADEGGMSCLDMVERGNIVVLRTFSKAYGLAGYRVGWGYFPPQIAAEVRKVMNPNNVATHAQAAAVAALEDDAYMRETCALTAELRDMTAMRLREAHFRVIPSHTNFLLVDLETEALAKSAEAVLLAKGIVLRRQAGAGLPQMLRITIGPREIMERTIFRLIDWKTGAQS